MIKGPGLAHLKINKFVVVCSGCGSVGRAVTSNIRDMRYESSHWQNFTIDIFTVNC